MIMVDFGTDRALALVGSIDISALSLDASRGVGMIVKDRTRLNRLKATFDRDWSVASD